MITTEGLPILHRLPQIFQAQNKRNFFSVEFSKFKTRLLPDIFKRIWMVGHKDLAKGADPWVSTRFTNKQELRF
jgi:hypothetical protein